MTQSDRLRNEIQHSGFALAVIARKAGIAMTTLHSFVAKSGTEMRTSNFEKVVAALASLKADAVHNQRGVLREDAAGFDGSSRLTIEVPLPPERAKALKDSGADIQAIARAGAEKALKEAEAKAWAEANRESIEASSAWIEKHGTFAEQLGLI